MRDRWLFIYIAAAVGVGAICGTGLGLSIGRDLLVHKTAQLDKQTTKLEKCLKRYEACQDQND